MKLAVVGNCQRIVRITAAPDLRAVTMNVGFEIDDTFTRRPTR